MTTPKDRVLDLLVFAPAGLALTVVEQLPELAEKGRNRIEGQAATARVVGQFVVQIGRSEITKRARQLFDGGSPAPEKAPAPQPRAQSSAVTRPRPENTAEDFRTAQDPVGSGEPDSRVASNGSAAGPDLAIPAYDTLSASQVVKRLSGLSHDELIEVAQHERSNRHRATILNRVEQLLTDPVNPNP